MATTLGVSIHDTPTERTRFHELTEAQQDALLDDIRERRLAALKAYEELQAAKQVANQTKLAIKAGALLLRMDKKLATVDKQLVDLEKIVRDARQAMVLMRTQA